MNRYPKTGVLLCTVYAGNPSKAKARFVDRGGYNNLMVSSAFLKEVDGKIKKT